MTRSLLAALLALCAGASAAVAQEVALLTVTVVDQATGRPVRDARVDVGGVRFPGRTDGRGQARLDVPVGNRIVEVTRLGYAPQRVAVLFEPGGAVERTVTLSTEAVAVEGVAARAERRDPGLDHRGYYDRKRRGFGAYLDSERIYALNAIRTLDIFRHVRGFNLTYDRRGNPQVVTTRGNNGMRPCPSPLVFLDGMLVASRSSDVAPMLDVVGPDQIAAIEAYAGAASIPVEFNPTGSACGVILIWTRTGTA